MTADPKGLARVLREALYDVSRSESILCESPSEVFANAMVSIEQVAATLENVIEPSGEVADPLAEGTADDLFMALSAIAHAKDVEANGPNDPMGRRSLHAVTLTMNEILVALGKLGRPDAVDEDDGDYRDRRGVDEIIDDLTWRVDRLIRENARLRASLPSPEGAPPEDRGPDDAQMLDWLDAKQENVVERDRVGDPELVAVAWRVELVAQCYNIRDAIRLAMTECAAIAQETDTETGFRQTQVTAGVSGDPGKKAILPPSVLQAIEQGDAPETGEATHG